MKLLSLGLGLALGWFSETPLWAAEPAEQLAYDAAIRDFDLGSWERAVQSLADFEAKYPQSNLRGEAGRRRQFAQAEVAFARSDWTAAAAGFAEFIRANSDSGLAAVAAVREAQARLNHGDRAGAAQALDAPAGPFARQLAAGTDPGVLYAGLMVKAEALRAESKWPEAAAVLNQAAAFAKPGVEAAARWQLLALVEEGAGRWEAAAQAAEAWEQALGAEGSSERRAEAAALAGRMWTRAGKPEPARAAYTRNVASSAPPARQLEAVLALADAAVARNELAAARDLLQTYLAGHAAEPASAAVRLRLGQILFRQFVAAGGLTNATPDALTLLTQASGLFADGLTNAPTPEVAAPLNLGRGWSVWYEAVAANNLDRLREAGTNFAAAAQTLPAGPEQAAARFKLADVQFRTGEPAAALTNYLFVLRGYPEVPAVQAELLTLALSQAALAALEAKDMPNAAELTRQLLERRPSSADARPSVLLMGQAWSMAGQPDRARAVFERFLQVFPDSDTAAEVELALVAADLRAMRWQSAIDSLDRWVTVHTNHPMLPRAEFDRAWAAAQAGLMTNAVAQFAALSVRFPTNPIAQTASLWLAGNFFTQGEYARAGQACVNILTNAAWRGTPGWHQARLLAAEAARRRQSFESAREQYLALLNDYATPTNLVPAAYFGLGETFLEQPPAPEQPPLANVQEALGAFTAAEKFTNSLVSVAALGKMADCYLQLATRATNNYAKAEELYRRVLDSPRADLASRSKAAIGLGVVAEKVAAGYSPALAAPLVTAALNHYLDVVNGALQRPGETPDAWWVKEAGREAGRLLESQGRWQEAATLYDRLGRELPALKGAWELRAAEARKRIAG